MRKFVRFFANERKFYVCDYEQIVSTVNGYYILILFVTNKLLKTPNLKEFLKKIIKSGAIEIITVGSGAEDLYDFINTEVYREIKNELPPAFKDDFMTNFEESLEEAIFGSITLSATPQYGKDGYNIIVFAGPKKVQQKFKNIINSLKEEDYFIEQHHK